MKTPHPPFGHPLPGGARGKKKPRPGIGMSVQPCQEDFLALGIPEVVADKAADKRRRRCRARGSADRSTRSTEGNISGATLKHLGYPTRPLCVNRQTGNFGVLGNPCRVIRD